MAQGFMTTELAWFVDLHNQSSTFRNNKIEGYSVTLQ